ncbi:(deoxy)nucleoside triphosphate pyrophosphohydrolase [Saprospiraceae bacterium]|mgnify:CR=1 FL=1|nr:(deoxy)nucleoside triphosphate pyrophosphohydrolase [Saprospiraceae bacterium]
MKKVEVVAAIIINKGQILGVERPKHKLSYISNKFEFPGGKIEDGESNKEALKRELFEELALNANIKDHFITVNHRYPDFELTMHAYIVKADSRQLSLNEHVSLKWLDQEEILNVDWAAADIPIANKLKSTAWKSL